MIILPVPYAESNLSGDSLIADPPYGARTHKGHNAGHEQTKSVTGQATRRAITYEPWAASDVEALVSWSADPIGGAPRISGWRAIFCSHDLVEPYMRSYERVGLYAFAPVAVIIPRPRLLGDGPASWLIYLMVARPKSRAFMRWRCLPGMYRASVERNAPVVGAKRVSLMQEVVRDYSNPGDIVVDPCAGWGSTGVAAFALGRAFRGAEKDRELAGSANARIEASLYQVPEITPESSKDKSAYVLDERDAEEAAE